MPDTHEPAVAQAPDAEVAASGRRALNEDWAATILGLVLLALVLVGVIAKGMVP
jgi:hypothetical protein